MTDPIQDVQQAVAQKEATPNSMLAAATLSLHDRLTALETKAQDFITRTEHDAEIEALRVEAAAKGFMARAWGWLHTTPGLIVLVLVAIVLTEWLGGGGDFACVGL